MGEQDDGSLTAARGAQQDEQDKSYSRPGFFARLLGAFSPPEQEETTGHTVEVSPGSPGIANLSKLRVDDVMIPKVDVVAVPMTISAGELVDVFRDSGYTRLPVFDGTLDNPKGFIHLKDFALKHGFNGNGDFDLAGLVRPAHFVPPSMPIGRLLTKMQTDRSHLALVIDEYGGTDGLVTLEDLIEQVIGEIEDEHDIAEAENFRKEGPGVYMVRAKIPLEEFEAEIGLTLTEHAEIDEEEIDTLGGLVFKLAGHVPALGEVIPHPAGVDFEITDADPRRIKRLRVRINSLGGATAAE